MSKILILSSQKLKKNIFNMEKILKNYTTIPDHLYVKRQADYQLKNIIDEMQRPGYVLVARQMGKTNLLLNAKRNLENFKRLVVYIDLSNLYEEEVECYRSIIDAIIESNEDFFTEILINIKEIREKKMPPHNEYLRSLLLLLKKFNGDIIIILDEIDALKSKSYSDNIFAQIRSNYFSRTNHIELERLTYILSGVIEPTELIKDKNKSPFNIGEKIYLDDFSLEEHNTFIYRSKLQISKDISEYIFQWINGNPRITFDVCSEIEKNILNGNVITKELIEEIINNKYLVAFDIAPVDHIRELLKTNEELREAIKCIFSGKNSNITDDIKKRLYLYGIISSDFNSNISIKNKIIERTINIDWLNSLDIDISYANAISKYGQGYFNEAIRTFETLLKEDNPLIMDEQIRYYIGQSYYNLDDFSKAVEWLDYEFQTEISFDSKIFLALSKLKMDNIEGIEILEEIAQIENKNSVNFYIAILNIAINTSDFEKAFHYLNLITDSSENININQKELRQLQTLSFFFKSNLYEKQLKFPEALVENQKALEISSVDEKPILLLNKIKLLKVSDKETDQEKISLVNFIVDERINFSDQKYYPISFNRLNLPFFFNETLGSGLTTFNNLFGYVSSNLLKGERECFDLLLQDNNSIPELCNYILENKYNSLALSQVISIYRIISSTKLSDANELNFKLYLNILTENIERYKLKEADYHCIMLKLMSFLQMKKLSNVIIYSEIALMLFTDLNSNLSNHVSTLVQYSKFVAEVQLDLKLNAIESANKTLKKLDLITEFLPEIMDITMASSIRDQATNIPFIRKNKIISQNDSQLTRRNKIITVKYHNGKTIKSKFKHIERDLLDGKCVIID